MTNSSKLYLGKQTIDKTDLKGKFEVFITEEGNLDVGIYDRGASVEKIFNKDDYEYDVIVVKKDKDKVLINLIFERFNLQW